MGQQALSRFNVMRITPRVDRAVGSPRGSLLDIRRDTTIGQVLEEDSPASF